MRSILMTLGLIVLSATPGSAQVPVFDNPSGLIQFAYAPYESGEYPEDYTELFSPALKALWDAMTARSQELEMPILDFDPFTNAQDYEISDLFVADPLIKGDTATVAVSFLNFSEPQELRFTLVRRAEGWKIDDIEAFGEYPWRLSELLAADPLLN
jgi:hypothetical protein